MLLAPHRRGLAAAARPAAQPSHLSLSTRTLRRAPASRRCSPAARRFAAPHIGKGTIASPLGGAYEARRPLALRRCVSFRLPRPAAARVPFAAAPQRRRRAAALAASKSLNI